jgi:hypothetical protein
MTVDPPTVGIALHDIPMSTGAVCRAGGVVERNNAPAWFDWLLKHGFIEPADVHGNTLRAEAPKRRTRRKSPPPDAAV